MPKNTLSRTFVLRIIFVMMVLGSGYLVNYWYTSLQLFPVKHVRIEGEFVYMDKALIRDKIAAHAVGGFFDLDIVSLRQELVNMQWIDDAFVRREWPESVVIRVVEKKPVAQWNSKGLLTANGDLFYPAEKTDVFELVKLKGPENRHEYVLSEFNKMQSLLHHVGMQIEVLSQNERRSWKMEVLDIEVFLGRKDIYKKIESLAGIYVSLIKPGAEKIKQIDFRYTNGFAVSWKQKTAMMMKSKIAHVMSMNLKKVDLNFLMGAMTYV